MGFSLVFNIFDAYIKEDNLMLTDDINTDMDKVIERANNIIISNGGEVLGRESIKMRICYPSISAEDFAFNTHIQGVQTEIFLFNKTDSNVAHVLCRNKINDEEFEVFVNEVDDHFLIISEKSKILNFRQTYLIEYNIIKLGDITFKIGLISKDNLTKFPFLELNNPYNSKYDEIKDFSYDIVQSLFFQNMNNYCLFDQTLEKLYRNQKLKTNNHWEFLQYVYYIFKK